MGEETPETGGTGPRVLGYWKPFEGVIPNSERAIAERYDLPETAELHDLLDKLRSYSARDLMEDWSANGFIQKRQAAHADLMNIIAAADHVHSAIASLETLIIGFEERYEYSPVLMESIANINMGEPEDLFLENELNSLGRFLRQQSVREPFLTNLDAVRSLPIRTSLAKARVPHTTLKKAVGAVRAFWRQAGGGWTADVLTATDDWEAEQLVTPAERFLVDVLRVTGFNYGANLSQLRAAWRARD
jgi:hypothetical protein